MRGECPCPRSERRVSANPAPSLEPDLNSDPQAQRRLRGQLEHIDYTAYASNREVIGHVLGHTDAARFQKLAVAAANARARWVALSLQITESPHALTPAEVERLSHMRAAYEELSEVYEAFRRMVERGYLTFKTAPV